MPDDESKLLDDLIKVAKGLAPSDLPAAADLPHVVGALIKVLDDSGTKVAPELVNPPDTLVSAGPARPPETGAVQHDPTRLDRIEAAIAKLLDNLADEDDTSASVSAPPPTPPTPPTSSLGSPSSSAPDVAPPSGPPTSSLSS